MGIGRYIVSKSTGQTLPSISRPDRSHGELVGSAFSTGNSYSRVRDEFARREQSVTLSGLSSIDAKTIDSIEL